MAFYGNHFSFNGIPCEKYGLMIYDLSGETQSGNGAIASVGEAVEEWLPSRRSSYYFGTKQNTPASFKLVFGLDPNAGRIDRDEPLDRFEIEEIGYWLTGGTDERKWLEIEQPDMEFVRYKCKITDLQYITDGWLPWAFSCTVTCDSAYGYTRRKRFACECEGTASLKIRSVSSVNDYRPVLEITVAEGGSSSGISIRNGNDEFCLKEVPTELNGKSFKVDCDTGVIIGADFVSNIYDLCDFKSGSPFIKLHRGLNELTLSGNFTLNVICEFPVSIGG